MIFKIKNNTEFTCKKLTSFSAKRGLTLTFRYIENVSGYYSFPLFSTFEEADYYERIVGNAIGGAHTHTYSNDPSNTTWYMPNTAMQMDYGLDPVTDGVTSFQGRPIVWHEIPTGTNQFPYTFPVTLS